MSCYQLLGSNSRTLFCKIMAIEKSLTLLKFKFVHDFVTTSSVNYNKTVSVSKHFHNFLCHKSYVRTLFIAGKLSYTYDRAVIGC